MNILVIKRGGPPYTETFLANGHIYAEFSIDADPALLRGRRFRVVIMNSIAWHEAPEPLQAKIASAWVRDGGLNLCGMVGERPRGFEHVQESPPQ